MAAKDLGTKYTCYKCGAKFYDMKKPEPRCPKCDANQNDSPALRAPEKPERKRVSRPVVEEPVLEEETVEEEAGLEGDEEAEEIPADDDDEDF